VDNLDVVSILKIGLPGLVFLLSLLSYHLLTNEQEKASPSDRMLKSIKQFMFINILLAVLTVAAPVVDRYVGGKQLDRGIYRISAMSNGDSLGKGYVAVCSSVDYVNRYLLVKDSASGRMIQVFAKTVLPCVSEIHISLTPDDASKLGWPAGTTSSEVEVVPAEVGQMFVL